MNSFGNIFRLTTFGESHGLGVGGVIDGMPAGVEVDTEFIQHELDRRRPGQSSIVTARKESDKVEILSGVFEGRSTGTPIGFVVYNQDQHSNDYDNLRDCYRSSARETISRCVAGALAKSALAGLGIRVRAYTSQVGPIALSGNYTDYNLDCIEENIVRCPDAETARRMIELISEVKAEGDTVGGVITGVVQGVPVGLGEPVFNKLHADLGAAMLGINAVKGFEYGMGFGGVQYRGSQMNDTFVVQDSLVMTETNHSGGIQGGISNGGDIYFRVAFKPVATLLRDIATIDKAGNPVIVKARGRHDPCVLPRAVPVVEAMAAMVVLDHYLMNKTKHL